MKHNLPTAIYGFEGIQRLWNHQRGVIIARILAGECYVTGNKELIETTLGSCIAACVRDPDRKIGGMNHFLLPHDKRVSSKSLSDSLRYGVFAMERLLNEVLKMGGERESLEVKITGGGKMYDGPNNVGEANIEFIKQYLVKENIPISAEDLGGEQPRRVVYDPMSGSLKVRKLDKIGEVILLSREKRYQESIDQKPIETGEIDLF